MDALRLVLIIGAAARMTRLTTRDKVTKPVRRWGHERILFNKAQRAARAAEQPAPPPRRRWAARLRLWLHELVRCDWCTAVWWAAAFTLADRHCQHPRRRAALHTLTTTLTASYTVGWLVEHETPAAPVVVTPAGTPHTIPEPRPHEEDTTSR